MRLPASSAPSSSEVNILRAVVAAQKAVSPLNPSYGDIASHARCDQSLVMRALRSLEEKKLIKRERNPGSERAKYRGAIAVTSRGYSVLVAFSDMTDEQLRRSPDESRSEATRRRRQKRD